VDIAEVMMREANLEHCNQQELTIDLVLWIDNVQTKTECRVWALSPVFTNVNEQFCSCYCQRFSPICILAGSFS
jgi:hypothetical protein